ncbi:MAG: hypothetical protein IPK64_22100 [bacterium]|nr:hypothetical protein [bacterium]
MVRKTARKTAAAVDVSPAVPVGAFRLSEFRVPSETASRIETFEMPVEDWIALPDHPHQRNTRRHANAPHLKFARRAGGAVADHLSHTVAARLGETCYKVDGHTRAHLWAQGKLPRPERVHVTLYRVADRAELDRLYAIFDSASAAKNRNDEVFAGYRECGIEPRSKRLRDGLLGDALNIALRGAARTQQSRRRPELDLFRAVAVFKDELVLLDGIDPQPNPFYSGVVAAALIGLALYPTDRTLDFFDKMNRKEGNRKAGRSDPVDAALTVVQEMMLAKAVVNAVRQAEICARTLRALLTWIAGPDQRRNQYWLQCGIKAADMEPILDKLKKKKGIQEDPSL